MYDKIYTFARLTVRAIYTHETLFRQCAAYETAGTPVFTVTVTEKDIEKERQSSEIAGFPDGYLESLAFYRKFCELAVSYRTLLFHSSAIAVDGKAYLFAAPSGTGKSTHTRLWREVFGERAWMVNDDKPLLRVTEDGQTEVWGTPWNGKHRLSTNGFAMVHGICILERGKENNIVRISGSDALPSLLSQTYHPETVVGMQQTLNLLVGIATRIPMYRLACNMSPDAAKIAYAAMSGDQTQL